MRVVRGADRPVLVRGPAFPTLQRLVDRSAGSDTVTVLVNVFTDGEAVPEHVHDVEEVLLVRAGACTVTVAGRQEAARAGDAVIVPPGTPHAIEHDGTQRCEVVAVLASPDARLSTAEANPAG
jgi:mannose-6-phosphate isomerase-like protein (cupin superfamily)